MSRGGRGGASKGGGGAMRVETLPFDVDVDLVSYLKQSEENDGTKKDVAKELFPVYPTLHPTLLTTY
jgi:hypothetical protein